MSNNKLLKYVTRNYSLRDRSLMFYTLFHPGYMSGIYYTEALDVMTDGLVTVYVNEDDWKRINNYLIDSIKNDSNFIHAGLVEGITRMRSLNFESKKDLEKLSLPELVDALEIANKVWDDFGTFLEFTHAIGRTKIELDEEDLKILSTFHNERKECFMNFFKYLQKVCVLICKDREIDDKTLDFLTLNEIRKFIKGEINEVEVNDFQNKRKNGYLYYYNAERVEEIVTDLKSDLALALLSRIESDEKKDLSGEPIYKGLVTGEVKIINIDSKLEDNLHGKIIVTTMTTPDMDFFLKGAAAIITEEGGILCHAAIFSREFKVPAITRVNGATKILRDGDIVEVDSNNGIIYKKQ